MGSVNIPINGFTSGSKVKSKQTISEITTNVSFLCCDISNFSQTSQFFICCVGVFIFYLMYGYLQELIFTLDGFKPFGWYLTLVQFAYYSVFGYIETVLKSVKRTIPLPVYLLLALLTLGTMGFSNSSLGYLNYPTQVIFKCCKLIPVLIGGILIQKKQYGLIDFLAAGCMCIGLTLFTLADSKVSPTFSVIGIFMISCALLCDAAIGNVQEKAMKTYKGSNSEVVLYSYAIGFMYLLIIMILSGDLQKGISFCSKHPKETYGYAFLFSISGYLGIQIVLTLVRTCGALVAATVTTCRKAVTIIISFIFFTKPFTYQYLWSGLLVVLGIYLNIYSKNPNKITLKDVIKRFQQTTQWIFSKVKHKSYSTEKRLLSDV
ncbi:adenosine 3'-phospho 5'-phosphosulfate transporter 2 [Anabrus simplex]|uniref:adenosine 3'-phospho 5'-phosphosulfate transporter 2 n=1 Tax=Anabrus simplex TaxID=316456 RepID=UPI0034DCE1F5